MSPRPRSAIRKDIEQEVFVDGFQFFFLIIAAMGRSQSTPGLVESRGKVPLEDMWVPPGLVGLTPAYPRSLLGSPPRQTPDSPGSTSSGRSHHHTPASQARSGKNENKKHNHQQ